MIIESTQFLRPDGRRRKLQLDIPDEYYSQYYLIHSCGCWLTCEQLMSGMAAHYITNEHGDFITKLSPAKEDGVTDEAVADKTLLEMINEFDKDKFEAWNKQFD